MAPARCRNCGALAFPPHLRCRHCHGTQFEEAPLEKGRLLTWTVIHYPPPHVKGPIRVGIVEFSGGVRALGELPESLEVGAAVAAEWEVLRTVEGKEVRGFRFVAAPS